MSLALITASRLKTARACLRLDYLRYDLGYRSTHEEAAPRFGTLLHSGLEAWWRAKAAGASDTDSLAAALAAVADAADPFERVKAEELLLGYHCRWWSEPLDVLLVEAPFEGPLRNPATGAASRTWRLAGKLDVLVRDRRDGLARLVEHKTSSEDITGGSEYWRRLRMDGQVSTYYDGAAFLGHEVAGCIYDVIGKPALRPGQVPVLDENGEKIVLTTQPTKSPNSDATFPAGTRVRTKDGKRWRQTGDAEAGFVLQTRDELPEEFRARLNESIASNPDRYYQRGEVVRLEAEMDEARFDTWQTASIIRDAQVADRHPRNPDACMRYGRTCEFFPVCSGETSLDSNQFVRLGNVHPELPGAVPEAQPKEEAPTP